MAGRSERQRAVAATAVLVAVVAVPVAWTAAHAPRWSSDALFYEAKRLEIQGATQDAALRQVFSRPVAKDVAADEDAPFRVVRVLDPAWVDYSARFFTRRVAVPAVAAAVAPVFGEDSIMAVGLVGYLLLGPVLFLLLRRRFSVGTSFCAALVCVVAPPVVRWGTHVGVDGWGMTLQALCYFALALVIERGFRWIPLWMGSMIVLSLTRDSTVAVGLALAIVVAFRVATLRANARHLVALGTGALAALPAPLLLSAPVRENMAYNIDESLIPTDTSWPYVLRHLPHQILVTLQSDLEKPLDYDPLVALGGYVAFALVVLALAVLVVRGRRDDDYFAVQQASLVSGVVYLLLSPNPTNYRLELVFLPAVAVAVALALVLVMRAVGARTASLHEREA